MIFLANHADAVSATHPCIPLKAPIMYGVSMRSFTVILSMLSIQLKSGTFWDHLAGS